MFRFAMPEMLYLLWVLAAYVLGNWWVSRQAAERLRQFTGHRLAAALTQQNSPAKQTLGRLAVLLAIACMLIGMARPQIALTRKEIKSEGLDIMLVVDTSRSMDAKDVSPTRLERARRALFYLVDNLSEHRIGLIPFTSNAFLNCPATQDTGTLKLIIDSLQTNTLPSQGTDLGTAMEEAINAFKRTGARQRAIIVISDGENFGLAPFQRVAQAVKDGIRTYTLGVGTEAGFPVPAEWTQSAAGPAPVGNSKAPVTRIHEKNLQKMAVLGNGSYGRLTSGGQEEERLVEELNRLEKMALYSESNFVWEEYYPVAALLALLLLIWDMLLGRRKGGPKLKEILNYLRWPFTAGLLVLLIWPVPAQASRKLINRGVVAFEKKDIREAEVLFNQAREASSANALAEYNYGCALLNQLKFEPAYQAFTRALPYAKGILLQDNWYNLAYTAFYLGIEKGKADKWQESAEGFKQCLLLNPQDDDARYNLEIVLRELKKHTRSSARKQEQSQGQEQGQAPGSGANKPGTDRQDAQGRENNNAPPSESQEKSSQRQDQKTRPSTSEQQQGKKQRGMSQEDALRTLRSLEAEENSIQKDWTQDSKQTDSYRGPAW